MRTRLLYGYMVLLLGVLFCVALLPALNVPGQPTPSPVLASNGAFATTNQIAGANSPTSTGYFVYDQHSSTFHTYGSRYNFRFRSDGVSIILPSGVTEMCFLDANLDVSMAGRNPVTAHANYFIGNDPAKWRWQAPMYTEVAYEAVYPGVDLIYTLHGGQLKSDFHIQPGVDVGQIRIRYAETVSLSLQDGVLEIRLLTGELFHEHIPIAYQDIEGHRQVVSIAFQLLDEHTYTFVIQGDYNPDYLLVIDPALLYSTYLGGSAWDEGWAIAVDKAGAIYITGITQSIDFPLTQPEQFALGNDVFVAKINPNGQLAYVSIFGGYWGEEGNAIGVDDYGNAYVGGETFSTDFPILNAWQPFFAGYEDAFLLKVDNQGGLVYSTFLGGSRGDEINDMVVDSIGNVYLGGEVYSDDFPLINPWSDKVYGDGVEHGFISIFNAYGELVYSTYVGAQHRDQVFRIAVDHNGYVYGTGMTSSPEFPVINPYQATYGGGWDDCFVFKLDPWTNTMFYSTFLGGSDRDECWGIAVDATGAAYVTGFTESPDFPVVNAIQPQIGGHHDVFVAKLSPAGNALLFSTFIGGQDKDWAWGLGLDGAANIYITGETFSYDFPMRNALQPYYGGEQDVFLMVLTSDGALKYSSFMGGTDNDRGWRLAVDENWLVHVTGSTYSTDFPLRAPYQQQHGGGADAFVATFGLVPTPTPTPTPTPIPTPTPYAAAAIGVEGGALWFSYPKHLTLLQVPYGAVSTTTAFELVYDRRLDLQGDLQGLNHFFVLKMHPAQTVLSPLHLTLGYQETRGVIADTIALYRLDDAQWITDNITIETRSVMSQAGHLTAWIEMPGTYGLLGQTRRLYLPLLLRHSK